MIGKSESQGGEAAEPLWRVASNWWRVAGALQEWATWHPTWREHRYLAGFSFAESSGRHSFPRVRPFETSTCNGREFDYGPSGLKIFVETTIPSYLVSRPARDLVQMARQQMTRYWWETCRGDHELFTSQIVLDEAGAGDPQSAQARLELLEPLPLLEISSDVLLFAQKIIKSGLLPVEADRDAAHIATATVHQLDALLSLNFRHLVNASIQTRLRRLALLEGYELPVICTPEELMDITI